MPMPATPKLYHITHVENLSGILAAGGLRSDAAMQRSGGPVETIGLNHIKTRRMANSVPCHPGLRVGDFVPFYFCPRSVMLFLVHCGNDPRLAYLGGQAPIVHLEFDLRAVGSWATEQGIRWAFSKGNAGAFYAEFSTDKGGIRLLDWEAIEAKDFRKREVKDGKQAEFLVHEFVPWHLVGRIGVVNSATQMRARQILAKSQPFVPVEIIQDWYF